MTDAIAVQPSGPVKITVTVAVPTKIIRIGVHRVRFVTGRSVAKVPLKLTGNRSRDRAEREGVSVDLLVLDHHVAKAVVALKVVGIAGTFGFTGIAKGEYLTVRAGNANRIPYIRADTVVADGDHHGGRCYTALRPMKVTVTVKVPMKSSG